MAKVILLYSTLDRFGRNKEEILQEWNDLTKNIEADIVVLDMPLLDMTQYKDSLGTFIADLVLQILSWMAEEREHIDLPLQNSIQFGRSPVLVSEEFKEIYRRWKAKELTAVEAMQDHAGSWS